MSRVFFARSLMSGATTAGILVEADMFGEMNGIMRGKSYQR
jgi:hypothetical protein